MSNMGHWTCALARVLRPGDNMGFVYLIKNKMNGRLYIGKKHYRTISGPNKGRINDRWKNYTGSCKELTNDIREFGKRNFKFIILEQYKTKKGLSFAEAWTQMMLETPCHKKFYNQFVDKILGKSSENVTPRHKRFIFDGKIDRL